MKIVAIIQARMRSSRLPGKVLMDIAGKTMLENVVERAKQAETLDEIAIATTTNKESESIVKICRERGWLCFRGSEDDVLDRYYRTALAFKASIIVRITGDCPLISPRVIDKAVREFLSCSPDIDYVSNVLVRTYPIGLDVEVMSFSALLRMWREATLSEDREHVTLYIRNNLDKFRTVNIRSDTDRSCIKWSVDTPRDLEKVRAEVLQRTIITSSP